MAHGGPQAITPITGSTIGMKNGGDDSRGVRPQMGVTILQKEMDGLLYKGDCEVAWDDVTNTELIPDLVSGS